MELSAQPVGDVAQVAIGARKMALFDVGVQEFPIASLHRLDEVGVMVASRLATGPGLELGPEERLPGLIAGDGKDPFGPVEDVADLDLKFVIRRQPAHLELKLAVVELETHE